MSVKARSSAFSVPTAPARRPPSACCWVFFAQRHGRATIFGLDCWRHSARIKRDVGYLPGDLRLYPWLTAQRALRIVGRVRGLDLRKSGADLAERFQLEMDLRVRRMSRGTRQKLGLIMALAHKPRLLVLDEPTSGLDPGDAGRAGRLSARACIRRPHGVFLQPHAARSGNAYATAWRWFGRAA